MHALLLVFAALAAEHPSTLKSFGLPEDYELHALPTAVGSVPQPTLSWSGRFAAPRTLGEDGFFPGVDDGRVVCVLDPGMAALTPSMTMHTYGSADLEMGTRVLSSALVSWALEVVDLEETRPVRSLRATWERITSREARRGSP